MYNSFPLGLGLPRKLLKSWEDVRVLLTWIDAFIPLSEILTFVNIKAAQIFLSGAFFFFFMFQRLLFLFFITQIITSVVV